MRRQIVFALICFLIPIFGIAKKMDMKAEIKLLKAQMKQLQSAQKKINMDSFKRQFHEVKAHDANDNIKFNADLRTSYDVIDYKINGAPNSSNAIWTNKLLLKMAAQPRDNLVFHGVLGVYKTFGYNAQESNNGFQNFDWYANETPSGDALLRLREAYFLYFGNMGEIPYEISFGRRPSVDGFLTNYRDYEDYPASPLGHNINMEFDGASFTLKLEKITGISGMYFKICLGRGNSNADAKYPGFGLQPNNNQVPYGQSNLNSANMDLVGLIVKLYDDGQYSAMFNSFKGWNMMGYDFSTHNLADVGDMTGGALSLQSSGVGDGINDFLDDTNIFASFAWSKTDPKGRHGYINANGTSASGTEMLGSPRSHIGTSYYIGANFPGVFVDGARWGVEYNSGSKYWRSFDYGEDTLIGSKLSARGNAYEAFYNLPLLGKFLTAQLRYTYIKYHYTGSDMFFGSTGTPKNVNTTLGAIKNASDLRVSIRYRY